MVGNDREEQRSRSVEEIMKRLTGYKDYTEEDFERMWRRAREIELRNMTGTWGNGRKKVREAQFKD